MVDGIEVVVDGKVVELRRACFVFGEDEQNCKL